MPRLKKKSASQRKEAARELMRSNRYGDGAGLAVETSTAFVMAPIQTGVFVSDGGLAHPAYSSSDEFALRPSVSLFSETGVLMLSDGGLAHPALQPSVSLNSLNDSKVFESDSKVLESDLKVSESDLTISESNAETFHESLHENLQPFLSRIETSNINFAKNHAAIFNSKPFSSTTFLLGSYHQGDERFSPESRGSQCTVIALCALIYAKFHGLSSKKCLDNLLNVGDSLYSQIIDQLKVQGLFINRLLCLDEIPNEVTVLNTVINIQKRQIESGLAIQEYGNEASSLHQSLSTVFQLVSNALIVIGSICSAVYKKNDCFWFFDSHSHGVDGLSSPDGGAILISFSCLDNLVAYMYAFYDSLLIDLTTQYEILPLEFSRSHSSLLDKYFQDQEHRTEMIRLQEKSHQVEPKTVRNSKAKNIDGSNRQLYQKKYKQAQRKSVEFKRREHFFQRVSKRKLRQNPEFQENERLAKSKARKDESFKQKEKSIQTASKRKERENPEFRCNEKLSKRKSREDVSFKQKERIIQTASKRKARENPEFGRSEKLSKRKSREDVKFKQKERIIQTASKRKARDCYYLEKERVAQQQKRKNTRNKTKERWTDKVRKAAKRKAEQYCHNESTARERKKYGPNIDTCIQLFHDSIHVGPLYVCSCCQQTWFKESVSQASTSSIKLKDYLTGTVSVDDKEWICSTCRSNILDNKIPRLSVKNGMKWPVKPKELELYPLEERLVALRIPFMQMRELPRGRQYSVKGNVVNVPVNIQPVVDALPRPFDENVTVAVKLKKRMSFKSCAFTENVRPLCVLVALHWLMKHSELYKQSNVHIDENWIEQVTQNRSEVVKEFFSSEMTEPDPSESEFVETARKKPACSTEEKLQYDSDDEETTQENVGNIDTLVDDGDIENRVSTFTFAPGEGQQPISIYQDKDSEFLCFPTLFCGQRRPENAERLVSVNYSDIAKWELRSADRRAANSIPNIFFKLKKVQMKQLNDKVNLAVRRCQTDQTNFTAAQARDFEYTQDMVKKDEGYYIFKQLRNSPAYLEAKKKDVFAMLRQLGLPTWFMSLSSADTRWIDLLQMLGKLNGDVHYSEEEITYMSWEHKTKLIQKDPVTCSRYFDHRVQQFIKVILRSTHHPLGEVTDYFYRVEFQQRGSPHIHMIVWVEGAPKYNFSSNDEIADYVDQFLKCSSDNPDLYDLIQLQIHKHSRTCRKKEDRICRFGYPLPPLPKTMVLEPLDLEVDKYKRMYQELQKKMNDKKDGYDMTYEHFLQDVVKLPEDEYLKCIRSTLNSSKVFLKRSPKDIRVNLYNDTVLKAWKANVDIQYVLDPYACAMYIVSYISKSQRGMSNLLNAAAKEARNGNLDIKRQVRHIGNVFTNSVEVSAQEAVYLVLQMPLTKSTREVVFVNTSPPQKRIQLLKSKKVLDDMPADSTDIMADNIIKRYSKRPKNLENWCLADYVSQLDVRYPVEYTSNDSDEETNDDDNLMLHHDENFDDGETLLTLKSGIKIKKRKNPKVLRYVRYSYKSDPENHFREKLLLFLPWRNETEDLIQNFPSFKEHYDAIKHLVDFKCKLYEHHVEELEKAREMAEIDYSAYDEIAPATQQIEADTAEEESVESETFVYFNPDRAAEHKHYDIGIEMGNTCSAPSVDCNDNLLQDEQYRELIRSLNTKQRHFYNHVIHWIKTKHEPLYAFLSGGAGVGKSVVIRALYQTLYRFLNLREGENCDEIRVLLCAYTGKAAFNINGSTISSAFKQKYKQADQTLTCDSLNTFRSKFRQLCVVIIDEISFVSATMFAFIDQRLQELTGTRKPFGGISIIAVGDLYQLKPVSGGWIFNDRKQGASALSQNLWKEHFTMFELTDIMRQKDDIPFAELLNRLRHNAMTDADKVQLKRREVKRNSEQHPLTAPHIFAENRFMKDFNDTIISNLKTHRVTVPCHDSVISPNLSKVMQQKVTHGLPDDLNKTGNLVSSLIVVVDMIYDLTVNINTEDGLANGASCVVKFIEYRQSETARPSIIWVLFDDQKIGIERRQKYLRKGLYNEQIHSSWTPVFDIERTFMYNRKTIQRIQFPLQPSAGRTVHRTQGCTLDEIVIDLTQNKVRKVPHLHYTAVSRVRSIENLHILNFNEAALQLDEQVEIEMERLHTSAMLELCYTPLDTVDSSSHFKIVYNNCRSLHKHVQDIKMDQNILSAHVIGLSETRLCNRDSDDDYEINGFQLIRNDQETRVQSKRPSHGLAVYVKSGDTILRQHSYNSVNFECTLVNVKNLNCEMQIAIVYKSPGFSFQSLISTMEENLFPQLNKSQPIIIIGDLNIDVSHTNTEIEQYFFSQLGCKQLVKSPTTDNGSTLDVVFSNYVGHTGVIETHWSDHKLVYYYT